VREKRGGGHSRASVSLQAREKENGGEGLAAAAFPLSISSPRVRPHILRPPRQDMAGQSTLDPAIVLEGKVGRVGYEERI